MLGLSLGIPFRPYDRSAIQQMLDALRRNNGSLWYVPDNLAGVYVDNVGTTPVTAVADLIGLITDKSYGGQLGVGLAPGGGTFDSVTGWLVGTGWTIGTGVASFPVADSVNRPVGFSGATAGKTYLITCDVVRTAGAYSFFAGNVGSDTGGVTASGPRQCTLTADVTGNFSFLARPGFVGSIDNFQAREVPGNPATQSAVASKPTVQRVPKRTLGATNLLLWSGDFGNAAWTKQQLTVATNATPAPDGGTCFKLTEDTATALHRVEQNWTATAGATYTIAVVVKAAERTWARLFEDSGGGSAWVNLSDGALGSVANGTAASAHLGNGWHLLVLTYAQTGTTLRFRLSTATANNIGSYAGDGTSGILLHRAGLFTGTVTAQQIIDNGGIPLTTTTALPNVLEWANVISFDGNNDFLQTGITTGNEGFVAAGVMFGGAAGANETVFASGAGSATQKGVWLLRNSTASALRMGVGNGTALTMDTVTALPLLNVPRVVEGGWDASTVIVGVDGITSSKAKTGDVTAPGTALIGAFLGGILPLQGPMHAIAYTPVLPSAADRATIRNGIAALQGRVL